MSSSMDWAPGESSTKLPFVLFFEVSIPERLYAVHGCLIVLKNNARICLVDRGAGGNISLANRFVIEEGARAHRWQANE